MSAAILSKASVYSCDRSQYTEFRPIYPLICSPKVIPMQKKVFEHVSVMPGTAQQLYAWHSDPKAFSRLTPPPIFIQMRANRLQGLTGGTVDFNMWLGPVPIHWIAQHEPGPTPTSFIDRQVTGPMGYWEHHHLMEDVAGGVKLTDRVTLAHKPGLAGVFSRLMFDGLPLRIFFTYRHLRTRMGMKG